MFIASKTVETHLSAVLRKMLEPASRWLTRRGESTEKSTG
jgi:hypothetical protein